VKSLTQDIILKILPSEDFNIINQLSVLFDNLIDLIFKKVGKRINQKNEEYKIHYLLYEEQVFFLAQYILHMKQHIITNELKNIDFSNFNIENEKRKLLGNDNKIENTAINLFTAIYNNKYKIRWIPKSKKLLKNTKKEFKKRNIKTVNKNHFITKSFIKKYWSNENLEIVIYNKNDLSNRKSSFGQFGHKMNLYSNELEDYFSLTESKCISIIDKIIQIIPINIVEKTSLIHFIIIHYLRNPYYFKGNFEELICSNNKNKSIQSMYETLFNNKNLYDKMTGNILLNQWCLLKSESNMFILPDTSLLYLLENNEPFIMFPISRKYCLSILPFKDNRKKEEKIIPINMSLDIDDTLKIVKFFIDFTHNNFVSNEEIYNHKDYLLKSEKIDYKDIITLIRNKIDI
jgi:hypothetical protein